MDVMKVYFNLFKMQFGIDYHTPGRFMHIVHAKIDRNRNIKSMTISLVRQC